tara:strand:+ start:254 stop:592 length:339 start_codon:yes stop_codon:yes gene_type:complete
MAVQENLKWGAKEYDCLNVNELKVGDLVVVPYDGGKEFYLGAIQHVKKDIEVVIKFWNSSKQEEESVTYRFNKKGGPPRIFSLGQAKKLYKENNKKNKFYKSINDNWNNIVR